MRSLFLALGGLIAVTYTPLLARSPSLAAATVLVLFALQGVLPTLPGFSLLSISIYPQDALFALLAAASMVRAFDRWRRSRVHLVLLGLVLLAGWSLLMGVREFGLEPAGNEARKYFYFLVGALYFSLFDPTPGLRQRVGTWWLATAGVLLLIAWGGWLLVLVNPSLFAVWREAEPSFRVLNAAEAFFLAQAWLLLYYRYLRQRLRPVQRFLFYVLGFSVLLLQHRTVWVVLVVAAVYPLLRHPRAVATVGPRLLPGLLATSVIILVLFGSALDSLVESLTFYVTEPFQERSTWLWRLEGWMYLLSPQYLPSPVAYITGLPFGSGFFRLVGGYPVDVSPHNFYVETLLRLGAAGVFFLLLTYLLVWRRFTRSAPDESQSMEILPARSLQGLLLLQLIYFMTYAPNYEQSILLGIAIAMHPRLAAGNSDGGHDALEPRPFVGGTSNGKEENGGTDDLPQSPGKDPSCAINSV